jgi:uncharacterized protein YfiM (DUF2279 family)
MTATLRRSPLGVASLVILTVLALLPQPWKGRLAIHGYFHGYAHMVAFMGVFLLTTWREESRARVSLVALFLFLFGLGLEILETRVYGNALEYHDIAANAAGIVLGLLLRGIWSN